MLSAPFSFGHFWELQPGESAITLSLLLALRLRLKDVHGPQNTAELIQFAPQPQALHSFCDLVTPCALQRVGHGISKASLLLSVPKTNAQADSCFISSDLSKSKISFRTAFSIHLNGKFGKQSSEH